MTDEFPWCFHYPRADPKHLACEYADDGRVCVAPRTHSVTYHRLRHPLCTEHAKPKYHPPDLRNKIRSES